MYAGKKLRQLRQYIGFNQEEFATQLGISQPYYSAVESGKKQITEKLLETIREKWDIGRDYFDASSTKLIQEYKGINYGGEVGGVSENKSDLSKRILYTGFYEENKIDYYYKHPETQLSKLLSVSIDAFKQAFNDYSKLVKVSNSFGAPDFIIEKFNQVAEFKEYKKSLDNERDEEHAHINDKKLLKCFQLISYEAEIEHWHNAVSQLIAYMDRYTDFYKAQAQERQNIKD